MKEQWIARYFKGLEIESGYPGSNLTCPTNIGVGEQSDYGIAFSHLHEDFRKLYYHLMSKAFTKETDDGDDDQDETDALPTGQKNYVTPQGFTALKDELRHLLSNERPKVVEIVSWAAGNGDRSENGDYIYGKKRLREIDRRIRFLTKRIDNAEVVDPRQQKNLDQVFFGATVCYAREDMEQTVTIVGVDEADLAKQKISWVSPLARAMMKAHAGDSVELPTPSGRQTIEIISVHYGVDKNA
jgi:transcription elongation factor GreB